MKTNVILLGVVLTAITLVITMTATSLHAGDGDLIVNGKVGVGAATPPNQLTVNQATNTDFNTADTYGMMLSNQGVRNLSFGSNGNYAYIQSWANKPLFINRLGNNIIFNGAVGIGTATPSATLHVNGVIAANVKNFDIADPRDSDSRKRLVHASMEGPEIGVYYRGETKLERGTTTVILPDYFEALTVKENRTVQLTPKFQSRGDALCSVAASDVKDGKFTIQAFGVSDPGVCQSGVYWEVKAERSDVEKLSVEQFREASPEATLNP